VHQDDPHLLGRDVGVVGKHAADEVVERARQLGTREAAPGHHEGDQRAPPLRIQLAVGALENVDHVVADTDGVAQRLEVERVLLDALHAQVVRHRAQCQHQVVVG